MAAPDPIRALVAHLRASAPIASRVGTRVFGESLPEAENNQMPRAAIVVSTAPGGGNLGKSNNFGDRVYDVVCYGPTTADARQTYNEVRALLKNLRRQVVADTSGTKVMLHWAQVTVEGNTGRDVGTDWPVCASSWQILAADIAA